ncbi:MAG TPA: RHS repeat-associated core domain-containing protein [Gemmatimonadales bacterium]|nr:RHS repeat-associated core domain-containing protein [Gemmatimonadales bacterium]
MDSIGGVNGELRWAYDLRGRLMADTAYSGTVPRTQAYTYDGWERAHTRTDAVGTWTTRFEGERGLPDTLFTPLGDSLSLGLDPLARVPTLKNVGPTGSGIELVNRNWNVSGALESMDHAVNVFSSPTWTALALERVEAVDSGGPPLGPMWIRQDGPLAAADTLRDTVAYDGWQRVVSYVLRSTATGHWRLLDLTYSFDAMGNRRTSTGGEVYNATTNQLRVAGSDTLTYDAAGNLSAKSAGQWSYGYDALERLVSVRKGGVLIARYGYDVAGRRIVKRVYSGSTGGTVGYLRMVYAGNQVGFETDSTNTSLSTIYTWGPGIDHLIGVKVGTTAYTVVTDPLGSVRALVRRSDGAWIGRMLYDPYGQLVDSAGPQPALRYRWTGREWDAETGFYFHRTRYYDPTVGRFVQEDQIGYAGSSNLYAYVNGDVLQARDSDGLEKEWVDASGFIPGCMGGSAVMGDGSIVAGACDGAGGRLAALGAWAWSAELHFYAWASYKDARSAFEATQREVLASTKTDAVMMRLKDMYTGARFVGFNQYEAAFATFASVPSSRDLFSFIAKVASRFASGSIFVNSRWVEEENARNGTTVAYAWSWRAFDITILHAEAESDLAFAAVHETYHLRGYALPDGPIGGTQQRMMEGIVNMMTEQLIGRGSVFQFERLQ